MMGATTGIAWSQRTQNFWHGCTPVGTPGKSGCDHCYMYTEKRRYGQDPTVCVRSKPTTFNAPLKWERELAAKGETALVFTCSWSDFFIVNADAWRPEAWDIIRRTPHCIYQILTKRHGRIAHHLPADWGDGYPNVWMGVTVENRDALRRLDVLRTIPARVRFASFEPLMEDLGDVNLEGIAWSIIGGESGADARTFDVAWARTLVRQCREQGSRPFVKQLGARPSTTLPDNESWPTHQVGAPWGGAQFHGDGFGNYLVRGLVRKADKPDEWPADLQVQEWPAVTP